MSLEQYKVLVDQQNNLCALCLNPEKITKRDGTVASLSVDHCHNTGRIRGLLCRHCNVAIGMLNDDPQLLKKAIIYLEKLN